MTPYGIDLGTTRSGIAYVNEYGKATLVDNALGERLTPSAVWVSARGTIVGKGARDAAGGYPDQVALTFKRHMEDPHWRFVSSAGRELSAIDLSAEVLRALAADVAASTGHAPTEVVIAVPAYFGHVARTATYAAGGAAGLDVLDVINEPTAAALAWMLESGTRPVEGLLVYDLGGGTFDSVVVRAQGDALQVVAIGGDNVLGGHDWDRVLALHFNQSFRERFPSATSPLADKQTDISWMTKAEDLKVFLAGSPVDSVEVVLHHGQHVLPVSVSRDEYDRLTSTLRERTLFSSIWVLTHARDRLGLEPKQVLLAGGMSRLPAIREVLRDRLGLTAVAMSRPDYMVAEGAALWALKRSAERQLGTAESAAVAQHLSSVHGLPSSFASMLARLSVTQVASRGFAIEHEINQGRQTRLTFLAHAQQELPQPPQQWQGMTVVDDQQCLELPVYEQKGQRETDRPRDHVRIGAARMDGIPPGWPAGTLVTAVFDLDTDQVIRLSFTHPGMAEPAAAQIYTGAPTNTGAGSK